VSEPVPPPDQTERGLAVACAEGDLDAQRALVEQLGPEIDRVAARFSRRIGREDARQLVLTRLFVAEEGAAPRIGSFRGEGSLSAFVRAVALRTLVNALNKRAEDPLSDSFVQKLPAPCGEDPETLARHEEQRRIVKAAFATAAAELAAKERALLRYAIVDGASIDAIGALYGVHRATAARWLEAARDSLARGMRRALAESPAGSADTEEVHTSIAGLLDLSIERVLAG